MSASCTNSVFYPLAWTRLQWFSINFDVIMYERTGDHLFYLCCSVKCYFEELKCLQNRTELWRKLTFLPSRSSCLGFISLRTTTHSVTESWFCRSELGAQRSWIILAKVSHIRTSIAKASLSLFHTMIKLMYVLWNIPRKLSCGRASVWKVLSKWHRQSFQLLFI